MVYLELFWSFFQVGAFSFGGGYASLPLIEELIINKHGWMTSAEFQNVLTISQITPGPISINTASFIGMKVAGIGGAIMCTLGNIMPSLILVLLLAYIYFKFTGFIGVKGVLAGLRPAVVGLILSAGLGIAVGSLFNNAETLFAVNLGNIDYVAVFLFIPAFISIYKFKVNPILVMLLCGLIGGIFYIYL